MADSLGRAPILTDRPCASTSSTRRPTRRPTTTPCARRSRRPARRSSSSRAASATATCAARRAATRVRERVLPLGAGAPGSRARRAARLAQHVPDMLRYRRPRARRRRRALPVARRPAARRRCCCRAAARGVLTAHDVLPREPRPRPARRASGGCTSAWTRSSCTPSTAARGCVDELGLDPGAGPRDPARRVHAPDRGCGPAARCRPSSRRRAGPVVLCFGLMRPYKGLDVLLEAWRAPSAATPSCGSSACRAWTSPPLRAGAPPPCAGSRASSPTPRLAAVFRPRRPRRAALPRDRPVRRAVHRARVRVAAAAHRRRRLPGGRGGRAPPSSSPPGDPDGARRGARRAARRSGPPRAPRRRRPAPRRHAGGRYGVGRDRAAHLALYARARGAPGADGPARDRTLAAVCQHAPPCAPCSGRCAGLLAWAQAGYRARCSRPCAAAAPDGPPPPPAPASRRPPARLAVVAAYARGGGDRGEGRRRARARLAARPPAGDRGGRRRRGPGRGCDRASAPPRPAPTSCSSCPRGGKVRAQDAAVRVASGELLAFSDANARWERGALAALAAAFEDPRVGYACGQVRFVSDAGTNQEGLYWRYELWLRAHESALHSVTAGNGAIYAVRRGGLPRGRPGHGPRPLVPVQPRQARVACGLRAGRPGDREDGPHGRGRVARASGA